MNENKLEKLKNVLELMQNDTVTPAKLAQFVTTLVKIVKDSKDSMESVSQETKDYLNKAISYLDKEHTKLLEQVSSETSKLDTKLTKKLDKSISDMKAMCEDLMMYKPIDGIDGKDGKDGIDGKDGSPDTPKEIKDKLESLEGDDRLDISAIKGSEKITTDKKLNDAISILDQRTQFLINRRVATSEGGGQVDSVVAGTGISVDSTDPANPIVTNSAPDQVVSLTGAGTTTVTGTYPSFTITSTGGSGGGDFLADGSVPMTGDLNMGGNDITDVVSIQADTSAGFSIKNASGTDCALLGAGGGCNVTFYDGVKLDTQTASTIASFDANKNITSLATATYPDLTELSYVKGVTSGIQTQLNGKLNLDQTTPQSIVNGIPSIITDVSNFTSASHIVNKEYVDQSISFIEDYYFNNTASSIGGIYYQMTDTQTGEAGSSFVSGTLTTGNDQALVNFATNAGIPGVITLRGGIYSAHIHASVNATLGSKSANIYYKLYSRTTGGTETLLATSEVSPNLTTTNSDYDLHANLVSDVSISNTDRIVIKWFVNVSGTGGDIVVTLYVENDYASRLSIPTGTDILSSIYIRQDGTKPLTADWNVGNYNITVPKIIGGTSTTSDLFLQTTSGVGATGADMHFLVGNNGGTEAMTILNSGNVGIGTTSPAYKLDVRGVSATDGISVDTSLNFRTVTAPTAPTYTLSSGGSVDTGTHHYFVTYTTALGETNSGGILNATVTAGNNTVNLTIPTSTDPRVTGRKIYRTKANQSSDAQYYLATISDNTTTSYIDTTADSSLTGSTFQYYRANTTSRYITVNNTKTMMFDSNLTAIGLNAGNTLTGSGNYAPVRTVLIGADAGKNITTGQANTVVGFAFGTATTASNSTIMGDLAGYNITTGSNNTILGAQAGRFLTIGTGNIILGDSAGRYLNDGSTQLTSSVDSIYIGKNVKGFSATENNSIVIGSNANGIGSNSVVLGNDSIVTTALKGNVGIGTTNPTAVLHLKAGTATANTAPLKFTSGTLNTTPEAGAIEFDGTDYYISI